MGYVYLDMVSPDQVGIDWITVTNPGSEQMFYEMLEVQLALDPDGKKEGKEWRFFGYEGKSYGDFSSGVRGEEGIMQFRSNLATEGIVHMPAGWRCTRIDLEVSILLEQEQAIARDYFVSLGGSNRASRPILRFMSSSNDAGDTLYVGSRKSKQMGRIYDKGAERRINKEGEIGSRLFWRYEVELKGDLARSVYNALHRKKGEFFTHISAYVWDWFTERGITPQYTRGEANLVIIKAVNEAVVDDAMSRKLEWLIRCCSPVVHELKSHYGDMIILEALGL